MSKKTPQPVPNPKDPAEIEKHCIAKNHGACDRTGQCLACSPLEQSIRAANYTVTRWPRAVKGRKA